MAIYYVGCIPYSDELFHHGIKGQKWGIRRYQNEDGTLTNAGKGRYRESIKFNNKKLNGNNYKTDKNNIANDKIVKKVLKIGVGIAAGALLAYGAYRLSKASNENKIEYAKSLIDTSFDKYSNVLADHTIFNPTRFEPTRFEPTIFEPSRFYK